LRRRADDAHRDEYLDAHLNHLSAT